MKNHKLDQQLLAEAYTRICEGRDITYYGDNWQSLVFNAIRQVISAIARGPEPEGRVIESMLSIITRPTYLYDDINKALINAKKEDNVHLQNFALLGAVTHIVDGLVAIYKNHDSSPSEQLTKDLEDSINSLKRQFPTEEIFKQKLPDIKRQIENMGNYSDTSKEVEDI